MCRSHSKLVSCNCTATPACSSAINYHFFPPSPINLDLQHFSHPLNFVFTLPRCNLHLATSILQLFFKVPLTNYTVTHLRSVLSCSVESRPPPALPRLVSLYLYGQHHQGSEKPCHSSVEFRVLAARRPGSRNLLACLP